MFKELNEQLEKLLEENKAIEFYTENLEQPIQCEVDLDKYGNGSGRYISGFDLGDTIAVRMLGTYNNDVYGFKIKEINNDNIIAIHPRSGNEYKISFNVKVSSGKELRFEAFEENSGWFAFLDLDKSMYKELVTYMNESNLPEFQKMDKLCDLDKHLSESGRYIGMKDSKYGIYKYVRTIQKFDGSWNYDYKLISPEFDEELDAIDWLAQDLLSNNSKQDFIDCIKEGSFKIYNDNLKQIMDLDVEEGTLNTNPKFPTGDNKGIDPIPNYMLEPNKAKANNLRRDYVQTHGKTYESLNEELEKYIINELSPALVRKVQKIRQEQADKLNKKVSKLKAYADKKTKEQAEKDSQEVARIRNRIAIILKDKPACEDIPSRLLKGYGDASGKVVKLSEPVVWKQDGRNIEYSYFVLPDYDRLKPVVFCSTWADKYDRYTGSYHFVAGSPYNFSDELPLWKMALEAVEKEFGDSEEDIKAKEKKAKRQEYNKKRWADSKPFDKFLQELKDKYGSGYIAQDVYGYTYVYKNKPYFEPTKDGYRGGEEFYEPGYWDGDRVDNIDYESKLNQAYKDQYRQDRPTNQNAIWSF